MSTICITFIHLTKHFSYSPVQEQPLAHEHFPRQLPDYGMPSLLISNITSKRHLRPIISFILLSRPLSAIWRLSAHLIRFWRVLCALSNSLHHITLQVRCQQLYNSEHVDSDMEQSHQHVVLAFWSSRWPRSRAKQGTQGRHFNSKYFRPRSADSNSQQLSLTDEKGWTGNQKPARCHSNGWVELWWTQILTKLSSKPPSHNICGKDNFRRRTDN